MGKELKFLFTSKCSYIPPHKSFLTWGQIPLNMWLSLTTWGRSQAFFLIVHPPFPSFPPKMQCYPSPQILSHLCVWKDSFPPSKCKTPQILYGTNSFIYRYFSFYFYWSMSLFWISFFFSFFFFSKFEILPQSWKIIPQHLGGIIEE